MFLLDSSVFIEAFRTYYSPTIAPTFWTWLAAQNAKGALASIQAVRDEIVAGQPDPLVAWANSLPQSFWQPPDQTAVDSMATLSKWTMDPQRRYSQAARSEFLSKADYHLVAQAHSGGHLVVTREQSSPDSIKRVLIPDACNGLGVECRDPFGVYQHLGLLM